MIDVEMQHIDEAREAPRTSGAKPEEGAPLFQHSQG